MGDEVSMKEIRTNQSDSFILHHSDHPGLVLVSKLLDGNNYGQWSRAMRIALSAKNKIGFINGTVKKPTKNDDKFQIWERCNHMVLSWILNSVESDIAGSIIYTESAADVWNDLQERFSQRNDTRIFEISQEISELRQGQQSVSVYYTKMKAFWDELTSHHDPVSCTCGGIKGLAEREEKERVMQFLMGLNDSFSTIRGSILLMNHIPDTRKTHALVLQHERQIEVAANRDHSGHAANFARPKTYNRMTSRQIIDAEFNRPTGGKKIYCTNCEMDGHTIDRCFYIHGFPTGHRYHGKDVKSKGRKSTNSSIASNVQMTETKQLTTKEYDQIMALLRKDTGNIEPLINTSGFNYEEDDWTGQTE